MPEPLGAVSASIRAENGDRIEDFVGAALGCFVTLPGTDDRILALLLRLHVIWVYSVVDSLVFLRSKG